MVQLFFGRKKSKKIIRFLKEREHDIAIGYENFGLLKEVFEIAMERKAKED